MNHVLFFDQTDHETEVFHKIGSYERLSGLFNIEQSVVRVFEKHVCPEECVLLNCKDP